MPKKTATAQTPESTNAAIVSKWNMTLSGRDISQHADVVKLECLAPFLFNDAKQADCWITWAEQCGLLFKWDTNYEELSNEDLKKVELMERAYLVVTNTIKGKDTPGMTVMLDLLQGCGRSRKTAKDVLVYVREENSKLLKKWVLKVDSLNKSDKENATSRKVDKEDLTLMSLLLVAQQYCEHITEWVQYNKDLVKQFEEELKSAEQNSEMMKNSGNDNFKKGNYLKAITSYNKAININKYSHILYSNRAQAYLKNGKYRKALLDGKRSVILKPDWPKGWYRYAEAYFEMGSLEEAKAVNERAQEACKSSASETGDLLKQAEKIKDRLVLPGNDDDIPDLCESDNSELDDRARRLKAKRRRSFSLSPRTLGMPALVDATDSDTLWFTDSDDPPDLVTDSDTADEMKVDVDDEIRSELQQNLRQGSQALLDERFRSAHRDYSKGHVLLEKHTYQFFKLEEIDYLVFQYAFSIAEIGTGGNDEINKAISKLDVLTKHKKIVFPLAYYGLGKAYVRQNRYDVALEPLNKGLKVSSQVSYCVLTWPGTQLVIEETREGKLQAAFESLIDRCLHPPPPDGVCRYDNCSGYFKGNIYFTDPDFVGMTRLICEDKCTIDFHPNCWKRVKANNEGKLSEKDFLGGTCFTPDCPGLVVLLQIFGNDSTVVKEFKNDVHVEKHKESEKNIPKKQTTSGPKKLSKKQRKKEQKRAAAAAANTNTNTTTTTTTTSTAVAASSGSHITMCNDDDIIEEITGAELDLDKLEAKADEKPTAVSDESYVEETVPKELENDTREPESESVVVIRKETEDEDMFKSSTQKSKQKKKKKEKAQKVLTLDEFIGPQESAYSHLPSTTNPDQCYPFAVPKEYNLLTVNQRHQPVDEVERKVFSIKENLFSYFKGILEANGPLYISDEIIETELRSFPPEARKVINDCGGLENLLKECLQFASIDGHLCLLKDAFKARQMAEKRRAQEMWTTVGGNVGNVPSPRFSISTGVSESSMSPAPSGPSESGSRPMTPTSVLSGQSSRPLTPLEVKPKADGFRIPEQADQEFTVPETMDNNGHFVDSVNKPVNILRNIASAPVIHTKSQYMTSTTSAYHQSAHFRNRPPFYLNTAVPPPNFVLASNATSHFAPPPVASNRGSYHHGGVGGTFNNLGPAGDAGNVLGSDADKLDDFALPVNSLLTANDNFERKSNSSLLPDYVLTTELSDADIKDRKQSVRSLRIDVAVLCVPETCDVAVATEDSVVARHDYMELVKENEFKNLQLNEARELESQLRGHVKGREAKIKDLEDKYQSLVGKYRILGDEYQKIFTDRNTSLEEIQTLKKHIVLMQTNEKRLSDELEDKTKKLNEMTEKINSMRATETPIRHNGQTGEAVSKVDRGTTLKNEIEVLKARLESAKQPYMLKLTDAREKRNSIAKYLQTPRERKPHLVKQAQSDLHQWSQQIAMLEKQLTDIQEAYDGQILLVQSGRPLSSLPPINLFNAHPPGNGASAQQFPSPNPGQPFGGHFRGGFNGQSGPQHPVHPAVSQGSAAVSHQPRTGKSGGSFVRIKAFLQQKYPTLTDDEIVQHMQVLRAKNNNSMSGLTLQHVVDGVSQLVKQSMQSKQKPAAEGGAVQPFTPIPLPPASNQWKVSSPPQELNEVFQEEEDPCIICHEELVTHHHVKLSCGHRYHLDCIRQWLNTNSTCPTCRVHVLLDDEFPSLGK